jgi:hypothetical protein
MFLAALLRKFEASASLSLAQEMGKVPTSRIAMRSAPTINYAGPNKDWSQQLQFDQPSAAAMFTAIKTDTSYTAPSAKDSTASRTSGSSGSATSGASGAIGVNGRAAAIKSALVTDRFADANITTGTAATKSSTVLHYP